MNSTTNRSVSLGSTPGSSADAPTQGGSGVVRLISKFEAQGGTRSNAQDATLLDEILPDRPRAYSGEYRPRKISDLRTDLAVAATRARTPGSLSIRETSSGDSLRLLPPSPLRNGWSAEEAAGEPAGAASKQKAEMVTMDELMTELDTVAEEIRQGFLSLERVEP